MKEVEISFFDTLKILWSFAWRGWILMFPAFIVIIPLMMWIMPFPKPGEAPIPAEQIPAFFPKFFLIWIAMVAAFTCSQVFAFKWLLKTKWKRVRLVAVDAEAYVGSEG